MKVGLLFVNAALCLGLAGLSMAQPANLTTSTIIPQSSIALPADAGVWAHTNVQVVAPAESLSGVTPAVSGPPFAGYFYQTPASIACIYGLVATSSICNPNTVFTNPSGGSKAIAIVDAYDDPNAAHDLASFSAQFGLPPANFQVVYATGVRPPPDSTGGWELEESLDIEWAHAMAPSAQIYLVEAASNSLTDLFTAVQVASRLVAAAGGGEVSMSWISGEFEGETAWDIYFNTPTVVYFASSGDAPGVNYPSASPYVVSAGGTTLSMSLMNGSFQGELVWDETGGGLSRYEATPVYQAGISGLNGARGTPDISFDANPSTGVWVYNSNLLNGMGGPANPWWIVGGTSVSAPSLAGIVNAAGHFYSSSTVELTEIYNLSLPSSFKDITSGACGLYASNQAKPGYDLCTGEGSPRGYKGK